MANAFRFFSPPLTAGLTPQEAMQHLGQHGVHGVHGDVVKELVQVIDRRRKTEGAAWVPICIGFR